MKWLPADGMVHHTANPGAAGPQSIAPRLPNLPLNPTKTSVSQTSLPGSFTTSNSRLSHSPKSGPSMPVTRSADDLRGGFIGNSPVFKKSNLANAGVSRGASPFPLRSSSAGNTSAPISRPRVSPSTSGRNSRESSRGRPDARKSSVPSQPASRAQSMPPATRRLSDANSAPSSRNQSPASLASFRFPTPSRTSSNEWLASPSGPSRPSRSPQSDRQSRASSAGPPIQRIPLIPECQHVGKLRNGLPGMCKTPLDTTKNQSGFCSKHAADIANLTPAMRDFRASAYRKPAHQ